MRGGGLGIVLSRLGAFFDFSFGFGDRLTHLQGDQPGVFGLAVPQDLRGVAQDLNPVFDRDQPPGLLGFRGRRQGRVHLLFGMGVERLDLLTR